MKPFIPVLQQAIILFVEGGLGMRAGTIVISVSVSETWRSVK